MTIKTIDEHAYEIVTEEGTFAVCKATLAKFDATKHEHGVAACGRCGCCFTGDCCDDTGCEHNHTEECGGKACLHSCHENREGHECAFCHLAFDPTRSPTMRSWPTSRNSRPSWLPEF